MNRRSAFSLVEVTLALGILAFTLITVAALIPMGLKSNQSSVQETHAANLLAMLESDLRNAYPAATFPGANPGYSQVFGLPLPYTVVSGRIQVNTNVLPPPPPAQATPTCYKTGVKDSDTAVPIATMPPAPFQASVIYDQYVSFPTTSTSVNPVQARLVISWPASASADPRQLTTNYLESFVTFPVP